MASCTEPTFHASCQSARSRRTGTGSRPSPFPDRRAIGKRDDIDRDLYRRNRSSVLKPVGGVPILGPAHSRPIIRSGSISVISDRSLQYVDDAWSVLMVVNRAEDGSRLEGEHTHSKLTPRHAVDLRAKVNSRNTCCNTFRLRCRLFIAHRAHLAVLPGPNVPPFVLVRRASTTQRRVAPLPGQSCRSSTRVPGNAWIQLRRAETDSTVLPAVSTDRDTGGWEACPRSAEPPHRPGERRHSATFLGVDRAEGLWSEIARRFELHRLGCGLPDLGPSALTQARFGDACWVLCILGVFRSSALAQVALGPSHHSWPWSSPP